MNWAKRRRTFGHWITLIVFAVWFGGFTFYAAVVVPLGSDVVGSVAQGFITQRVTHWLNALGAVSLALLAWEITTLSRSRRLAWWSWAALGVTWLGLLVAHGLLDRRLDTATFSVENPQEFYRLHQVYLWLSVIQWLACLTIAAVLFRRSCV